jgi:hypothetical protein
MLLSLRLVLVGVEDLAWVLFGESERWARSRVDVWRRGCGGSLLFKEAKAKVDECKLLRFE